MECIAPAAPETTVVQALCAALAALEAAPPAPADLLAAFAPVPDPRRPQGRRFPLPAILALAVAALLANHRSVLAMAHWGARQQRSLLAHLGFQGGKTPHQPTLQRLFRTLDPAALSVAMGRYFAAALPVPQQRGEQGWPSTAKPSAVGSPSPRPRAARYTPSAPTATTAGSCWRSRRSAAVPTKRRPN